MVKRRPGRLLPLEVTILEAGLRVQAEEDSFYGFALVRRIAEREGGPQIGHGTLYRALSRLTTAGFLDATWEEPEVAEADGRPRRRLYRVTGEGEGALSAEWSALRAEAAAAATSAAPARRGVVLP
ncbi:MAG: helix-turn-helix transcriptional regulator [Herbiconiux sp.]|nr:helix-turn-helix transcriptional regulator [Herbiconiux sp.]